MGMPPKGSTMGKKRGGGGLRQGAQELAEGVGGIHG